MCVCVCRFEGLINREQKKSNSSDENDEIDNQLASKLVTKYNFSFLLVSLLNSTNRRRIVKKYKNS